MSEKVACEKFCQIISAVEYCHLKNIVHRDLKIENLLLDVNMNVKLVDFGFANYFDLKSPLNTFCGSPPYAAPEIFIGKKYYGPEIDVWSLGVILYVLVSASLPFDSENLQRLKNLILNCKYRIPYFLSSECEHLIRNLLVVNPSKRFKIQQIKAHKWIKLNNSSYYYKSNNLEKQMLNEAAPSKGLDAKKFSRLSNKYKSKSLKNICLESHYLSAENDKLAKSYLSLPLYSSENSAQSDSNEIVKLVNELSIDSKNEARPVHHDSSVKPHEHHKCTTNLESHLKCPAFCKLISNSSSLDEGVESDFSLSSSISNDVLSNSKASFNSVQVSSLESQSSQKSSQLSLDKEYSKCMQIRPKSFLKSNQALLKRYKFSTLRKNFLKPSNTSKYGTDLASLKRELNSLIKTSLKNTNLNQISECPSLNGVEMCHKQEASCDLFGKILKKESKSSETATNRRWLFRQKSSSLSSINVVDSYRQNGLNSKIECGSKDSKSCRKNSLKL
ncbi:MAP microtubule affinity-regulating kinase -like protein [Brachionus plicatilis]|uniref:MAP microtubule affinity-regulating kinase-like protein n=1 Tax=Brachionus plicatilis TaxID=10195 RepID=A0A3M7P442_BRAPC|nr:MAP microtubule affinity-regulating kinase -like protein [Brachionus plicatilis]